jgi:hypothetical protein
MTIKGAVPMRNEDVLLHGCFVVGELEAMRDADSRRVSRRCRSDCGDECYSRACPTPQAPLPPWCSRGSRRDGGVVRRGDPWLDVA